MQLKNINNVIWKILIKLALVIMVLLRYKVLPASELIAINILTVIKFSFSIIASFLDSISLKDTDCMLEIEPWLLLLLEIESGLLLLLEKEPEFDSDNSSFLALVDITDSKTVRPFLVKGLTCPSTGLVPCFLIKSAISWIRVNFSGFLGL